MNCFLMGIKIHLCVFHVSSKECTRDCNTQHTQILSWFEYQRAQILKQARQRRPPRGYKIGGTQINHILILFFPWKFLRLK